MDPDCVLTQSGEKWTKDSEYLLFIREIQNNFQTFLSGSFIKYSFSNEKKKKIEGLWLVWLSGLSAGL